MGLDYQAPIVLSTSVLSVAVRPSGQWSCCAGGSGGFGGGFGGGSGGFGGARDWLGLDLPLVWWLAGGVGVFTLAGNAYTLVGTLDL